MPTGTMPKTIKQKEAARAYNAKYWANLTPEKRAQYNAGFPEYWANLTPEKKEEFRKYRRNWRMKRVYGLTSEQWDWMFENQGRRCAICHKDEPGGKGEWHTDHCHASGKLREILCHDCNTLLGRARDNDQILLNAISYLLKHREPSCLQ